jgi:hypothetical protein
MSADNGIYILQTPVMNGDGFEYRVVHAQAIDNIFWGENGYNKDGDPKAVVEYFGKCEVFQGEESARTEAFRLYDEITEGEDGYGIVEYGVSTIELPHFFDYYWMQANADTA